MYSILIVDDDPWIRSLLRHLIEKENHNAMLSSNSERALTILEDNPHINLVILDMQMPGMNGQELAKQIRSTPETSDIPIIMVSGFVQAHEVSDILKHGVDRFVPKPIDHDQITGYINDMLEMNRAKSA